MKREEVINYLMEKGILVSPDFFQGTDEELDFDSFNQLLNKAGTGPLVLNNDLSLNSKSEFLSNFNWVDFDSAKVLQEKNGHSTIYSKFVDLLACDDAKTGFVYPEPPQFQIENKELPVLKEGNGVKVIFSYEEKNKKREVKDFVNYFKRRYESIKGLLCSRSELQDSLSIARLSRKKEGEAVSIVGLVLDKRITKNENIKFTLEDPTGTFDVLVTKKRDEIYQIAKDIVLDEVIGVTGVLGTKIIFCNNLYFPDIPLNHELKKASDEAYAVFISDIHFGIKNFLELDFMRFIKWLCGEYGTEQQKEVSKKVKYLFITGDVVEGVGIYPGQEEDLEIKDIYEQYEEATKYFKMSPERINIIICGGNHDAMRMSEPQPIFDRTISKGFYEIPNMIMVSNPAMVNIHASSGFPGFDVLMYHGASFPYYGDIVPSIRDKGGLSRCDLIMKFLLQRRHLAPSHSSTLYVPDEDCDSLVINKIPDIFVSGHIHQINVSTYRNVSMVNSSCWVIQSEDNAKRGIVPHPGKIPIINLKTREIKIMNFLDDSVKVLVSERLGLK